MREGEAIYRELRKKISDKTIKILVVPVVLAELLGFVSPSGSVWQDAL